MVLRFFVTRTASTSTGYSGSPVTSRRNFKPPRPEDFRACIPLFDDRRGCIPVVSVVPSYVNCVYCRKTWERIYIEERALNRPLDWSLTGISVCGQMMRFGITV